MNIEWGWDNARAFLGILLIYGICWALSESKRKLPWRIILGATVIQVGFALALYGVPILRIGLENAGVVVDQLQAASRAGTDFVFGWVGNNQVANQTLVTQVDPATGTPKFLPPLFFFQILPLIIVVAALSAILWHWHVLRWVTKGFAFVFSKTMGLGGATSLAVSANVFMGMTEAPVLIKPYIPRMTRSEIFIVMTAGFATIAGSVLVIYVTFLAPVMANPLPQLLVASLMAAPAAVAVALTIVPETIDIRERASEPSKPSPSMYWSSIAKTGKARAAVRRYWNLRKTDKSEDKAYDTSLWVLLSHKAGTLGEVCTMIGKHKCNISNVELVDKKDDFLSFIFDLEIKNLKDFTNLVSEIKQLGINFKIIRNRKVDADRKKN